MLIDSMFLSKMSENKLFNFLAIISILSSIFMLQFVGQAEAETQLTSAYVRLSDSRPNAPANVSYVTGWTFPGTTSIQCMNILFATTASGSTKPTGMVTTSATKGSVSGGGLTNGNWTLYNTVDGTLQYEYASGGGSTATAVTITTNGITNPTSAGVYYAQLTTYTTLSTHTCTVPVSTTTIAFRVNNGQALSVTVDPSLTFAVNNVAGSQTVNGSSTTVATTADTIALGNVNSSTNVIAAQDLVVTTNAQNGYTVYASYSGTLTDANSNTIADWTGTNTAPTTFSAAGTSAFGYTTESTSLSGTAARFGSGKWAKFETWNYEVARSTVAVSADTTRVGYQVGVSGTQKAGLYQTTIVLTATPTY